MYQNQVSQWALLSVAKDIPRYTSAYTKYQKTFGAYLMCNLVCTMNVPNVIVLWQHKYKKFSVLLYFYFPRCFPCCKRWMPCLLLYCFSSWYLQLMTSNVYESANEVQRVRVWCTSYMWLKGMAVCVLCVINSLCVTVYAWAGLAHRSTDALHTYTPPCNYITNTTQPGLWPSVSIPWNQVI